MGITFTRVVVLKGSRHLAEIGNNGMVIYMFDREGNLMVDMVSSMLLKEDYRTPTKYERIHYFRFKANYLFGELVKRGDKSAKLADHNTLLEDENRQLKCQVQDLKDKIRSQDALLADRDEDMENLKIENYSVFARQNEELVAARRELMEWMGWRWSFKLFGIRIYIF